MISRAFLKEAFSPAVFKLTVVHPVSVLCPTRGTTPGPAGRLGTPSVARALRASFPAAQQWECLPEALLRAARDRVVTRESCCPVGRGRHRITESRNAVERAGPQTQHLPLWARNTHLEPQTGSRVFTCIPRCLVSVCLPALL